MLRKLSQAVALQRRVEATLLRRMAQSEFWIRAKMAKRRGQNTVEYMLMLGVVVVVILAVGGLLKAFVPQLFQKIQMKIMGAADQ